MVWRRQAADTFGVMKSELELTVEAPPDRNFVRFLVRSHRRSGAPVLLGSGTASDLRHGMQAAEQMAERLRPPKKTMPSIMLVDDEDSTRYILADLLRERGHVVREARSGESALQQLERVTGAVTLVTDINLGSGMSGLELAAAARALRPGIRLMIISGYSISPSYADTVLLKPFSSELFLTKVTDLATGRMPGVAGSE